MYSVRDQLNIYRYFVQRDNFFKDLVILHLIRNFIRLNSEVLSGFNI